MQQWANPSVAQVQSPTAQEERQRLARELHDSVAQILYGITLEAAAAGRACRAGNASQIEQRLADIQEDATQALCEIRLLICELDPPLLQEAGLAVALSTCLAKIEQRSGLQTGLCSEGIQRSPPTIENELYRIAVEALNNVVRHAHAQRVQVSLGQAEEWVWLEISDDGQGFEVEKTQPSGSCGLNNMQARAEKIQGQIYIESQPGKGTRIRVEAPLAKGEPDEPYPYSRR